MVKRITNWAGNESWTPGDIVYPETLQDLVSAVREATKNNLKVKPLGSTHSFSDSAATSGIQLDMKKLNRILNVDVQNKTIEAEAGILLKDLYKEFSKHSLALSSIPNTDDISLGGAIANVTHGTNFHEGTYSSMVVAITLVTGEGKVLNLKRDSQNELERKYFGAAIASFGAIGVFYSLTLQLVDDYDMLVQRKTLALSEVQGNIQNLSLAHDCIQFMIFPIQKMVFTKTQKKIKKGIFHPSSSSSIHNLAFEIILWMMNPKKNRLLAYFFRKIMELRNFKKMISPYYQSLQITNWSDGELSRHKTRFVNMEYALPMDQIESVIQKILEISHKYKMAKGYSRHLPFILRPVGADSVGFMSTTHNTPTCFIDILFQCLNDVELEFYKELESLFLSHGGRVSWSRKFFATKEVLLNSFSHNKIFLEVAKELDPKQTFSNSFTKKVLGY